MSLTLLVLENPWKGDASDDLSVLPFVEGLAKYSPDAVRVFAKPFYRIEELSYWLQDFVRPRWGVGKRIVYVAAHGTKGLFGGLPDDTNRIQFQSFHDSLREAGRIDGVHLGCCDFGNRDNAKSLLQPDHRRKHSVPCRWVTGYDREIDWFGSTIVDLVFWRELLRDPKHDAWKACIRTYKRYPEALKLGFRVYCKGPHGIFKDSVEYSNEVRKDT